MQSNNFPVLEKNWSAQEEFDLLNSISDCGFQNWWATYRFSKCIVSCKEVFKSIVCCVKVKLTTQILKIFDCLRTEVAKQVQSKTEEGKCICNFCLMFCLWNNDHTTNVSLKHFLSLFWHDFMIREKFHKVCQVAIVKLLWLKLIVLKESKLFSKFMLYGVLTLYTLRSVFIFSVLFSIYFLW